LRDPAEGSVAVDAWDPVPSRLEVDAIGLQNPIPLTDESVEIGSALYDIYCLHCHGVEVSLDPTQKTPFQVKAEASGMVPFPISIIRVRSDAYIFSTITNGGAIMKRLDYHLDPEERWHIVNYVRSIANKSLENQ
jgi:mono/diheme cytochrome c family protein